MSDKTPPKNQKHENNKYFVMMTPEKSPQGNFTGKYTGKIGKLKGDQDSPSRYISTKSKTFTNFAKSKKSKKSKNFKISNGHERTSLELNLIDPIFEKNL